MYNVITNRGLQNMKAKLVQIGNSRGVRLPKPIIEEAQLEDEVDIHVREGSVIITSMAKVRAGWAESAKELHDQKADVLVDAYTATSFDETEWKW
jgi:antitoxin MazE